MELKIKFFARFFSLLLFFIFFSAQPVRASDSSEFKTFCTVNYRFFDNGNASVSQEISVVNQKPDLYVTEYTLRIPEKSLQNVMAWDRLGPLKISLSKDNEETLVKMTFNEKVVGLQQNLSFILKYDVPGLAEKIGRLWKISLPMLSSQNSPEEYKIILKIPGSYGLLAFSSPYPEKIEQSESLKIYSFLKPDLVNYGIILLFGDYQVFDFNLNYHLQNQNKFSVFQFISLPPDTEYQDITYTSISPNPENVIKDEDGNWLAKYFLKPEQTVDIRATGKVKLFSSPVNKLPQENDLEKYLQSNTFWETDSPTISELASNLKTPSEIYNFVVKTLNYDYDKVNTKSNRKGALAALKEPDSCLCTEFTDLFIALARAAKIPAREVEGFAYTDNPKLRPLSLTNDILHAWPEYFDNESQTWRMIDPTWGKTTGGYDYFRNFDMSHFAFVIHGLDSKYPPTPGSFKSSSQSTKDIFIDLGQDEQFKESEIKIDSFVLNNNLFEKEMTGKIEIKNLGPKAVYNLPVNITSSVSLQSDLKNNLLTEILPYGKTEIIIKFNRDYKHFLNSYVLPLTVQVGEKKFSQNLIITPLISNNILKFAFAVIALIISMLSLIFLRKRLKLIKSDEDLN